MTRASGILGMLLGLVSIIGGVLGFVRADSTASLLAGVGVGLAVLVSAFFALQRRFPAQVALLVLAFALLGRFVPAYFMKPLVWPSLVMIALSSITFGLGLLGVVLDRYKRPAPR